MTSHRSRRLYRVLLWAFPRKMRDDMGTDMELLFAAQIDRTRGVARVRLFYHAIADALYHGLAERYADRRYAHGIA